MSVPRHGLDCGTHTFPAKCGKCGDDVYFFSCTCGSRVFFDELGSPWPVHDCRFSTSDRRWAQGRPRMNLDGGGVRVEISDGVTAMRPAEGRPVGWNIDLAVVDEARREAQSREHNPIESVPPGANWKEEIIGVLRELDSSVDVHRRLGVPKTELGKGFLGDLAAGTWGRMTIHVLKSRSYSYSAWIPKSLIPKGGLQVGVTVSAVLERWDVATKAREWVCRCFRVE